jgi:hypothetical protein
MQQKAGHKKVLQEERFHKIKAALQEYRLDGFIRNLEGQRGVGKGAILPFIRGLRFSALLIYAIREYLLGTGLTASWGHIIDEEGEFCSRECDIVIHKEGHIMRWNGDGGLHPVMDFKFIEQENAVAVISCKSYLTKSKIEKEYCQDILKYVDRVWLFAECCQPNKIEEINQEAINIGYEKFWTFYTWDKETGNTEDQKELWHDFIQSLKSLKA